MGVDRMGRNSRSHAIYCILLCCCWLLDREEDNGRQLLRQGRGGKVEIVIEEDYEVALYSYSTDITRDSDLEFLKYWRTTGPHYRHGREGEVIAVKRGEAVHTMHISPLPGHEETVERFIAIGRMKNKDFPFKIFEESL